MVSTIFLVTIFSTTLFIALPETSGSAIPVKADPNPNVTHPVIFVPGIEGSQLYAKLNRSLLDHIFCYKSTKDYYSLWINPMQLLPEIVKCFVQNMRLQYNNVTRKTSNAPGVDIEVPHELDAIEWLSEYHYSVYEQGEYFTNFKKLVEETYTMNGGKKVAIVCHSMGSLFTLYFLNGQTQAWKDKYVHAMATIGAPWGGSIVALQATTVGYNLGVWLIKSDDLLDMERTFPSTAFLLPSSQAFPKDLPVIVSPNRNYTIDDIQDFFKDIDDDISYDMWQDTSKLLQLNHPGVDLMCVHGYGLDTTEQMFYKSMSKFPRKPTIVNGDGDSTVNIHSLSACKRWANNTKKRFVYKTWPQGDHVQMVKDMNVINQVYQFVES